jgi:DNA-binding response OmpR family regulator
VVFITGHAGEGDQIRALRAGALDYVPKPVSFRTLAGKIPALAGPRGGVA